MPKKPKKEDYVYCDTCDRLYHKGDLDEPGFWSDAPEGTKVCPKCETVLVKPAAKEE